MSNQQVIIEPPRGWKVIDWKEVCEYRDLFFFLTWRNIKARYAQSIIGIGWAVIQPFFSMVVFTIVFGNLAKIDSQGAPYALFSFAALVPWTYFANALTETTSSLINQAHILTKVYFPRIILPLSSVVAKLVDFGISLLILFGMMAAYGTAPTRGVVILPLLVILMILTATGMGLWLTTLAVQYRDVAYASGFLVQLLMYAAPVVYPTSLIPIKYQMFYALNPMVGIIEGFRSILLGTSPIPWVYISIGSVVSIMITIFGAVYFHRKEKLFADVA